MHRRSTRENPPKRRCSPKRDLPESCHVWIPASRDARVGAARHNRSRQPRSRPTTRRALGARRRAPGDRKRRRTTPRPSSRGPTPTPRLDTVWSRDPVGRRGESTASSRASRRRHAESCRRWRTRKVSPSHRRDRSPARREGSRVRSGSRRYSRSHRSYRAHSTVRTPRECDRKHGHAV